MTQAMKALPRAVHAVRCFATAAYSFGDLSRFAHTLLELVLPGLWIRILVLVLHCRSAVTREAMRPLQTVVSGLGASPILSCSRESHPTLVVYSVSSHRSRPILDGGDLRGLKYMFWPEEVVEDNQYSQVRTGLKWSAKTHTIGSFPLRPNLRLGMLAHLVEVPWLSSPKFFPKYLTGLTLIDYLGIAFAKLEGRYDGSAYAWRSLPRL